MNRKLFILITGILIVLIVSFILLQQLSRKTQTKLPADVSPTVLVPTTSVTENSIETNTFVASMEPADESDQVATDTVSLITFTQNYSMDELNVEVVPSTEFAYSLNDTQLVLEFLEGLAPSTRYTITVGTGSGDTYKLIAIQSFVTAGPEPTPFQYGTRDAVEADQQFLLENNPDMYVANLLPYETNSFSISERLTMNENGTATSTFIISVKPGSTRETAEAALRDWLASQRLTQQQINQLRFEYTQIR